MEWIRALTDGEARLVRGAFGAAVGLDRVRVLAWPFRRAFVAGRWFGRDWIVWPHRALRKDFSAAPEGLQALLVHEMTHVWQAQQGVNLLLAKLKAGDSAASYAYRPDAHCRWDALNIEQQAMLMEHRFLAGRGRKTPGDAAFYNAVCPFSGGMRDATPCAPIQDAPS